MNEKDQGQGPKPESPLLDKPFTRGDFLRLVGLGIIAYGITRAAPYVEPMLKQRLAEFSLYFGLTPGEYAVRMVTVDSKSANEIWNNVLNSKKVEGRIITTKSSVDDNGDLYFYQEDTGRKYVCSGQEAELNYIPPKGRKTGKTGIVKMQINGNEIYIAPYISEFQTGTPDGETTMRETIYTFVNREGNPIAYGSRREWPDWGQASILFAATKAISPSGETVRAVVDTTAFIDNGKIFDIKIPYETGEISFSVTHDGLFKNGGGQFFRAEFTRTGLCYLQENWGHPVAALPPSSQETVIK